MCLFWELNVSEIIKLIIIYLFSYYLNIYLAIFIEFIFFLKFNEWLYLLHTHTLRFKGKGEIYSHLTNREYCILELEDKY